MWSRILGDDEGEDEEFARRPLMVHYPGPDKWLGRMALAGFPIRATTPLRWCGPDGQGFATAGTGAEISEVAHYDNEALVVLVSTSRQRALDFDEAGNVIKVLRLRRTICRIRRRHPRTW